MSVDPAYCIPVVETADNRKPIGVVTDRDIVCRLVAKGMNPLVHTAEDCMTMPCLIVGEDESLEQCREILEENQIRRLVVVDENGSLSGIVSLSDIVRVDPEHAGQKSLDFDLRCNAPFRTFRLPGCFRGLSVAHRIRVRHTRRLNRMAFDFPIQLAIYFFDSRAV